MLYTSTPEFTASSQCKNRNRSFRSGEVERAEHESKIAETTSRQDLAAWLAAYLQRCDGNCVANATWEANEILSRARAELKPATAAAAEVIAESPDGGLLRDQLLRRCIAIASSRYRDPVESQRSPQSLVDSDAVAKEERNGRRWVVPETCHRPMTPNEQPSKLWFVHWSGWCRRSAEVYQSVLELTAA